MLNILDYLFIKGFSAGIAGAAYATIISQLISVLMCYIYIRKRCPELHLKAEDFKITLGEYGELLSSGITMGFMNKFLKDSDDETIEGTSSVDEYYNIKPQDALAEDGRSKMILLEPRAYSESFQIIDHLKDRDAVVVNLKRVTQAQAKRIVDVLNGAIYAIGGQIQKIGGGIFLLTPNNVNIEGQISDEKESGKDNDKDDVEW